MINKMGFEIETCTRCGGSGQYSYNQLTGTRCFKCHGNKHTLTKRGAAARDFFVSSQHKPIGDLKPGMFFWQTPMGRKAHWDKITNVEPSSSVYTTMPDGTKLTYTLISCETGSGLQALPQAKVRAITDQAELDALKQAALAYQDTLGKSGKPLKRAAA